MLSSDLLQKDLLLSLSLVQTHPKLLYNLVRIEGLVHYSLLFLPLCLLLLILIYAI